MLSGITVTCFAASYAVALLLEISRLFFQSGVRAAVLIGFMVAGLFAHTWFLGMQVVAQAPGGAPLASWFDWFLVAAWVLVVVYLYLAAYHPKNPIGLFLLPVVLGLIGVAYLFDDRPFPANRASQVWGTVHGVSLLLGTVVVILGFIAGVMYLVQSYRLKHKLPPSDRFKLPSLEWLETTINRSIAISTLLLAAGVLSGVILNVAIRVGRGASGLGWNDPVVWTSGLLFGWLMAAWLFSALYRPARRGRKVAYLTFATFGFLVLTLAVVLWAPSDHPASTGKISDFRFQISDWATDNLQSAICNLKSAAHGGSV